MALDSKPTDIKFTCDDCETEVDCNVAQVRLGSATCAGTGDPSDFVECWRYMQGTGWRSFKRVGHPWTYYCVKCGPAAEVAHREHKRQEVNRDRLKHKNARE